MVAGRRLAAATSPWVLLGRSSVFEQFFKALGPAAAVSVAFLFVIGYSYSDTYYARFGLQLHEIDVGYLEAIEYSAHLFRNPIVYVPMIFVVFIIAIAVRFVSNKYFLSLTLVLMLFGTPVPIGHYLGNQYATRIVMGIDGRTAYCKLKEKKFSNEEFKEKFKKATDGGRVIKIKETKKMMYLFISPKPEKLEESDHGDSYVFHKSDISHCRVAGARS